MPTSRGSARVIRPRWPLWQVLDNDVWLVGARAKVDDVDLAVLLREVEAAVSGLDLQAIRYCLDGRFYIMECVTAPEVAVAAPSGGR